MVVRPYFKCAAHETYILEIQIPSVVNNMSSNKHVVVPVDPIEHLIPAFFRDNV